VAIVEPDYTLWSLRFPELVSGVPEPLYKAYFAESSLYVTNTQATSQIPYDPACGAYDRQMIINLVVAHIAALNAPIGGKPSSSLVGRISDASEGSVSVSATLDDVPGSAAWFTQTKYGLSAWQAMAPYRTARYRASPGRFFQPARYGYGYGPNGYGQW
jgi:hypothetical protein